MTTYTLAEARAIIDDEKCERTPDDNWCRRHGHHWPMWEPECKARPEVADVAADLLARLERVEKLVDEVGHSGVCAVHLTGDHVCGCWFGIVKDAFNGEEETE